MDNVMKIHSEIMRKMAEAVETNSPVFDGEALRALEGIKYFLKESDFGTKSTTIKFAIVIPEEMRRKRDRSQYLKGVVKGIRIILKSWCGLDLFGKLMVSMGECDEEERKAGFHSSVTINFVKNARTS